MCGCNGEIKKACECAEKRKKQQIATVIVGVFFGFVAYMGFFNWRKDGSGKISLSVMVGGLVAVVMAFGYAICLWWRGRAKTEDTPSV